MILYHFVGPGNSWTSGKVLMPLKYTVEDSQGNLHLFIYCFGSFHYTSLQGLINNKILLMKTNFEVPKGERTMVKEIEEIKGMEGQICKQLSLPLRRLFLLGDASASGCGEDHRPNFANISPGSAVLLCSVSK